MDPAIPAQEASHLERAQVVVVSTDQTGEFKSQSHSQSRVQTDDTYNRLVNFEQRRKLRLADLRKEVSINLSRNSSRN